MLVNLEWMNQWFNHWINFVKPYVLCECTYEEYEENVEFIDQKEKKNRREKTYWKRMFKCCPYADWCIVILIKIIHCYDCRLSNIISVDASWVLYKLNSVVSYSFSHKLRAIFSILSMCDSYFILNWKRKKTIKSNCISIS